MFEGSPQDRQKMNGHPFITLPRWHQEARDALYGLAVDAAVVRLKAWF